MQRGNAFSTSANAVTVKKPVDDKVQKDASKKDVNEEIADSQILKNLGKYLLLNDSPDFRFRVALSLGLLVGAKVKAEICSLQFEKSVWIFAEDSLPIPHRHFPLFLYEKDLLVLL